MKIAEKFKQHKRSSILEVPLAEVLLTPNYLIP